MRNSYLRARLRSHAQISGRKISQTLNGILASINIMVQFWMLSPAKAHINFGNSDRGLNFISETKTILK